MHSKATRFSIYEHQFTTLDGSILRRFLIVLVLADETTVFTNFHKYCRSPYKSVRRAASTDEARVKFIVPFLNYVFFYEGIESLDNLTADIVNRYLNAYGMCELPWDDEFTHRKESTVQRAAKYILDFLTLYMEDRKNQCKLKKSHLYRTVDVRDRHGKSVKRKELIFDIRSKGNNRTILRDMPNAAFDIMFYYVMENHPELLGLVMLGAFAGLRPSEACNVRREDSPLGPGILFTKVNGRVEDIAIDLSAEKKLRSDNVNVGNIKKERIQHVSPLFIDLFVDAYNIYLDYLKDKTYEEEYGPLSINRSGKAMTNASYYTAFVKIFKEELAPIYLKSDDPDVVVFGKLLSEHNIGPHILRHWFTVQLVLAGVSNPADLMKWRGDTSPESAIWYLNNKGELSRKFKKLNNESFEYQYWKAEKQHERRRKNDNEHRPED